MRGSWGDLPEKRAQNWDKIQLANEGGNIQRFCTYASPNRPLGKFRPFAFICGYLSLFLAGLPVFLLVPASLLSEGDCANFSRNSCKAESGFAVWVGSTSASTGPALGGLAL